MTDWHARAMRKLIKTSLTIELEEMRDEARAFGNYKLMNMAHDELDRRSNPSRHKRGRKK